MNRLCAAWLIVMVVYFSEANGVQAQQGGNVRVYFGTSTSDKSRGIYFSTLNIAEGTLSPAELAVEVANPTFLAIHPSRKLLYSVCQISDQQGKKIGGVSAFAIDPASGQLTLLNQQPSAGAGPCHLVVDAAGRHVLVANFMGGNASVLPLGASGLLAEPSSVVQHQGSGPVRLRQDAPHAHSINLDPANRFAFVADLGLDKVFIYRFNGENGILSANDPASVAVAPGSGPRHLAFHPSGKYVFVNNEISSTITSFAYDAGRGSLTEIHTVPTLAEPNPANSTAETIVHPSGRFVYVSNRGHDSLAMYRFDEATGRLTNIGYHPTGGRTPRNFNIEPTGRFVIAANQESGNVVVHRIDVNSGKLTSTGNSIEVNRAICIRFLPLTD